MVVTPPWQNRAVNVLSAANLILSSAMKSLAGSTAFQFCANAAKTESLERRKNNERLRPSISQPQQEVRE